MPRIPAVVPAFRLLFSPFPFDEQEGIVDCEFVVVGFVFGFFVGFVRLHEKGKRKLCGVHQAQRDRCQ
jgi:hypothetical protein